jgi:flagellar basal body rod protein FlgG
MNNGLYISAMGLQVQQYRQTVVANNLANIGTVGFKRALANTQARATAAIEDPRMGAYAQDPIYSQLGGGVWAQQSAFDWSQGNLMAGTSKTDMAIKGEGFFSVKDPSGAKLLTRNGQFDLSPDGALVTKQGYSVLDSSGEPITVNPAIPVAVKENGDIVQAGQTVATVGILNINDTAGLEPVGQNTLRVRQGYKTLPAESAVIKQGFLEQSGVEPMTEILSMMEGQRAFEANARLITMQDQMMSQLNTVGRVA